MIHVEEELEGLLVDVEIKRLKHQRDLLLLAGKALVDRWDTPLWKDAQHTALYINALRKEIESTKTQEYNKPYKILGYTDPSEIEYKNTTRIYITDTEGEDGCTVPIFVLNIK